VPKDNPNDNPPRAGEICATCPNSDLVAAKKAHFGRQVWHFECSQAIELYAKDSGIVIKCSGLDGPCCVENSRDVFVGSPDINPLKEFLETTLGYLGLK
jgi:hypothetical protein